MNTESPSFFRVVGSTLEFDFSLYMSDGSPIAADLFADSLKGMERLLKDSPSAFLKFRDSKSRISRTARDLSAICFEGPQRAAAPMP